MKIGELGLALLLFTTLCLLRVGNRDVRTANAIADDHPVVWANYAKNPAQWAGDPIQIQSEFFLKATLQNRLVSFLYSRFGVSPEWLTDLQVWIQNVGLGLALLFLCRFLDPRPVFYWTAAVAVFIAHPWAINLAYFPDVYFVPYAAHLALPFLIVGLTAFLLDRQRLFLAALFPAAVIHPLQTMHLLMILFPTLLFSFDRRGQWLRYLGYFAAIAFVTMLPPFFLGAFRPISGATLTNSELLAALLPNGHVTPWNVPMIRAWVFPTFLGFFVTAIFSVRQENGDGLRPLLKGCAVATLVGGLVQGAAAYWGWPSVLLATTLRCTVIVAVVLLAIVVVKALRATEGISFGGRWFALLAILFQMYSGFGVFWAQWTAMLGGGRFLNPRRLTVATVLWTAALLMAGRPLRALGWENATQAIRTFLAPAAGFDSTILLVSLVLAAGLAFAAWPSRYRSQAILAVVVGLALLMHYRGGRETRSGPLFEIYRMQKWAKDNTPPGTLFLSMTRWNWRGISERPVLFVDVGPQTIVPYWRDRRLSEWNRKIGETFHRYGQDLDLMGEVEILQLNENFGAAYLLRSPTSASLFFRECFRNSAGVIYELPKRHL